MSTIFDGSEKFVGSVSFGDWLSFLPFLIDHVRIIPYSNAPTDGHICSQNGQNAQIGAQGVHQQQKCMLLVVQLYRETLRPSRRASTGLPLLFPQSFFVYAAKSPVPTPLSDPVAPPLVFFGRLQGTNRAHRPKEIPKCKPQTEAILLVSRARWTPSAEKETNQETNKPTNPFPHFPLRRF